MEELKSLEVGSHELAVGGNFNDVVLSGMGKIKGSVEAKVVESNGISSIIGAVKAQTLMISGSLSVDKEIELEHSVNIKGSGTFLKELKCQEVLVQGSLTIKGDIKCKIANINGLLSSKASFTGDEFKLSGQLDMYGNIRANIVEINFFEKSTFNEILADTVNITTSHDEKKGLLSKLKLRTMLKCIEIKAKEVFIENVDCKLIVAEKIIIGENCKVEKVEYTEKFEFDKSSEVKETICNK